MDPVRHLTSTRQPAPPRVVGRYLMYEEISCGGMASVHFGRLSSHAGFSRTVAIKYLHPQYARDKQFISMFLDEARLVSRIRHPNVAAPLDVVVVPDSQEVFLVMEYIHGETLGRLMEEAFLLHLPLPPNISANILCGALHGLHAAHEAVDEMGKPLNIVHRDISPQNIMVGSDGVPRVLDFGIAKAVSRSQSTQEGQVKGKVAYMAPEQLTQAGADRRADIFAAGIVLWEALTMRRLFRADHPAAAIANVLHTVVPRPSSINGNVSQAMDRVVLKALNRTPAARFQTARDFAAAIEEEAFVASTRKVSEWVSLAAVKSLAGRAEAVARIESESHDMSALEGQGQSAQSLRTTSQTVAVLQESDRQEAEQQGRICTPNPERTPAGQQRWEVPTTVLSPSPPEADALQGSQDAPAASPATAAASRTLRVVTQTALVAVARRRRWLALGAAVGLALVAASIAAFVIFRPASVAAPPASVARVPDIKPMVSPAVTRIAVGPDAVGDKRPAGKGPGRHEEPAAVTVATSARAAKPKQAREARFMKSAKDCDPPFFVDRAGIRRIKPQCL
jgi:eukaryotic-like serine/threonine-protein kinase